jgi:hypothetical protein
MNERSWPTSGIDSPRPSGISEWDATGFEVLGPSAFAGTRLRKMGRIAVCFGASWCPWTRRFVRRFGALPTSENTRVSIADLTDTNSPLWDSFRIRVTPSIVCFEDGEPVLRIDGRRLLGIRGRDLHRLERFLESFGGSRGRGQGERGEPVS